MEFTENMLKAARVYCERTGRALSTTATLVMNDGKFFDRIQSGGGCTIATYQKVMEWFAANTPPPAANRVKRKPRKQAIVKTTGDLE